MTSIGTTTAFRLALGVVGLHIADDNFFQPAAGTSAADHLVSGLVPLALLTLAAWAFPRLRAGAQGALRSWPHGHRHGNRGHPLRGRERRFR